MGKCKHGAQEGGGAWGWGLAFGQGSSIGSTQRCEGSSLAGSPWQWGARGSLTLLSPLQVEPPELPEDLLLWIAYNKASSRLLRAESGVDAAKNQ